MPPKDTSDDQETKKCVRNNDENNKAKEIDKVR